MNRTGFLLALIFILFLTACSNTDNTSDTSATFEPETQATESVLVDETTSETIDEPAEPTVELETYYDRDTAINLYLNYFNEKNPEYQITSDLFEVYYHHGREHDDQIIFTRDEVEIVISGNSWDNSIKLVIDGSGEKTHDDYKLLFIQYGQAFNQALTKETLDEYWQAVLDDIINNVDFDEFECSLHTYNDKIEYMIIEGRLQ